MLNIFLRRRCSHLCSHMKLADSCQNKVNKILTNSLSSGFLCFSGDKKIFHNVIQGRSIFKYQNVSAMTGLSRIVQSFHRFSFIMTRVGVTACIKEAAEDCIHSAFNCRTDNMEPGKSSSHVPPRTTTVSHCDQFCCFRKHLIRF